MKPTAGKEGEVQRQLAGMRDKEKMDAIEFYEATVNSWKKDVQAIESKLDEAVKNIPEDAWKRMKAKHKSAKDVCSTSLAAMGQLLNNVKTDEEVFPDELPCVASARSGLDQAKVISDELLEVFVFSKRVPMLRLTFHFQKLVAGIDFAMFELMGKLRIFFLLPFWWPESRGKERTRRGRGRQGRRPMRGESSSTCSN